MTRQYQMCKRCLMDTTDPEIEFDAEGICNHCKHYLDRVKNELHSGEEGRLQLEKIINAIKREGRNRRYDCIIGVSGGIDSSYVAYKVKELGLRPLAVHLDNGWDTELSVDNIKKILKMGIDLYTCVLDWEEFKDLQLSFLRSSLVDCEIPTDHAIVSSLYRQAAKEGVRYVIGGTNIITEAVAPRYWMRFKMDWTLIKAVQARFGKKKLKNFLHMSLLDIAYCTFVKGIRMIHLLDYIPYNKAEAKRILEEKIGWRDYGGKHYESVYTRFYQGYILPEKFGIDKRKAHYSALVCSGQMTRQEALEKIKEPPYRDARMIADDKEYVIKKFGISEDEFDRIMAQPPADYDTYPNDFRVYEKFRHFTAFCRKIATGDPNFNLKDGIVEMIGKYKRK